MTFIEIDQRVWIRYLLLVLFPTAAVLLSLLFVYVFGLGFIGPPLGILVAAVLTFLGYRALRRDGS